MSFEMSARKSIDGTDSARIERGASASWFALFGLVVLSLSSVSAQTYQFILQASNAAPGLDTGLSIPAGTLVIVDSGGGSR